MAGSGELFQRSDGKWGFRVKSADGDTVATDGGQQFSAKAKARSTLKQLLEGDFNGPIRERKGGGGGGGALTCGAEITQNTTLTADVTCKGGPGLVIAADNVTLDLAGHSVSRDPGAGTGGPGILFRGVKGSTVKNGTVQRFEAGILIDGGSGNTVEKVTVQDNIGSPDGELGDGIIVNSSTGNHIQGNTVLRNGPFSGIALGPNAQGNHVHDNVVTDNNMSHTGDPSAGRQDMGIRVEGPGASNNMVAGNNVSGSGSNGISLHPVCGDPNSNPPCVGPPPNEGNEVSNNTSNRNGTSGRGDGIKLFNPSNPIPATKTKITGNVTNENKTFGICIDAGSSDNTVTGNSAHGNGQFDGNDGNTAPPCGTNTWSGNDFGLVNQPCLQGAPKISPVM